MQLLALLVGHVSAVVLAHDGALRLVGRRRGHAGDLGRVGRRGASIVAAALLVLK